jgi:hypothetical protein
MIKGAFNTNLLIFQHAAEYANLIASNLLAPVRQSCFTRLRLIIIQAIDKFIEVRSP